MQFYRTREADCFTGQTFNTCPQCQVVTLNTLSEDFSCQMLIFREFSGLTAPVIAGYHTDVKRRQQSQKFTAGVIRARSKRVSQNATCFGVVCIPEPMLPGFIADKAPLLIKLTDKCYIGMSDRRGSYSLRREFFNVRMTVLIPIFSVLAVSRTPAPLNAISVICSLTPGLRAS